MTMAGKTKEMSQIKQLLLLKKEGVSNRKTAVRIPVDTRSPIPVISVQSVGDLQYHWQSYMPSG